ncbi:MAG: hypothetical protein CL910_04710 [Deltaproteobacteria bacterium]|nr:hypothetical protein [Deltaproteobacteria bacterium]
MPDMRFNHMELTLAKGELTAHREEIRSFYQELLGWEGLDVPILKQTGLLLRTDPETSQFILVTQVDEPLQSPGFDHLGLIYETRAEVDVLLERCKKWQARDDRVRIKEYEDLETGGGTVHAFYVKFLLPIWFDIQCMEWAEGQAPAKSWHYA